MSKKYMRLPALSVCLLAAALFVAGCGCGKKNTDPETQEVLKISITPEPSPTAAPETVNSDAVVTNGGITMVNSYLSGGNGTAGTDSGNTENTADAGTDSTVSTDDGTDSGASEEETSEADSGNE